MPLPGSARAPLPNAHVVGPAALDERLEVTVRVRPRSSLQALATAKTMTAHLPHERQYMSRDDYAARYGADPKDLDTVAAFAKAEFEEIVVSSLKRAGLFEEVKERIAADPAVQSVALASGLSAMNHIIGPVEFVGDGAGPALTGGTQRPCRRDKFADDAGQRVGKRFPSWKHPPALPILSEPDIGCERTSSRPARARVGSSTSSTADAPGAFASRAPRRQRRSSRS